MTLTRFLHEDILFDDFENKDEAIDRFAELDDFDILAGLKVWSSHEDEVLSFLSASIVNRRLFKIEISNHIDCSLWIQIFNHNQFS